MTTRFLTSTKLCWTVVCVVLGWTLGSAAIAQDRVTPNQGVAASGKIVKLTPNQVTIEVRGRNQNYDIGDLRKITFDDEPRELDRARESFILEQYDQALEEIKKIDVTAIENPLIRQDVEFYRYYCEGKLSLAGSGDKAAAIKGLIAVGNANRETHHLYALSEMLGELALAVGQPEKARSYFGVLTSAADDDTKAKGVYRLGLVELSEENAEDAKTRFQQLVTAPSNSPEMTRLKSLAEVGSAACDSLLGDAEGALQKLKALVKKSDPANHELFARIYNAMGACYQSQGKSQQALLSYLKTDLLFFTEPEAHAESLYYLKKLWPQVGKADRAADAGSRLTNRYASSTWANKP